MGDSQPDDTTEKELSAYLIVNWKDETLKSRKTEPDDTNLSPYEIAIPASVTVVVPEVEIPEIAARVEVPRPNVESGLLEDAAWEGDPDAWKEVADDLLDGAFKREGEVNDDTVMQLVGRTLTTADVPADPTRVKHYLRREIRDRVEAPKA